MLNDDDLKKFADPEEESDFNDKMCIHFEDFESLECYDIADEGGRVLRLVTGDPHDEYESPIPAIISAVAVQAHTAMAKAIGRALGVNGKAVEMVLSNWYENQRSVQVPVTMKTFMKMVKKEQRSMEKTIQDDDFYIR